MIIKRRFETYEALIQRDPDAREMIKKYIYDDDTLEFLKHSGGILHHAEMGCGISNPRELGNLFDKLDKEKPYDNGLNYKDVKEVLMLDASRKGNAAIFVLLDKGYDNYERVVDIFAVDNKSGEKVIIEPWDIPRWHGSF